MEKRLVRYTTIFTCLFSVFACVAVWFLPALERSVEDFAQGMIRERREREERYALLEQMTALEILDYNTKQVQAQARIEQEQARKEQEEKAQAENANQAESRNPGNPKNPKNPNESEDSNASQEPEKLPEVALQVMTHQMQLELPKGTDGSQVQVIQDYMNRQIRIGIPRADDKYLYDYQMIGESEKIESMDYTSSGGNGMLLLTMKNIVEAQTSSDENYLYLDFKSPKELYDRIIVVDAGHGGSDPGAVSAQYYEKHMTLAVVQKIKELFDRSGDRTIGVYYTRLDDSDPSLSGRVALANNLDADLFVSIHINSVNGDASVQGIEVMYDELAADTAFDTQDFAQICLDETTKATGAVKRHLVNGHQIHIIRNSHAPAALIELGFINNPMELANLIDPSYQQKAAEGVYHALVRSLKRIERIEKNQT